MNLLHKILAREDKPPPPPFAIFATHVGLVHDVTDTDRWAGNGSSSGRVLLDFQTLIVHKRPGTQ